MLWSNIPFYSPLSSNRHARTVQNGGWLQAVVSLCTTKPSFFFVSSLLLYFWSTFESKGLFIDMFKNEFQVRRLIFVVLKPFFKLLFSDCSVYLRLFPLAKLYSYRIVIQSVQPQEALPVLVVYFNVFLSPRVVRMSRYSAPKAEIPYQNGGWQEQGFVRSLTKTSKAMFMSWKASLQLRKWVSQKTRNNPCS